MSFYYGKKWVDSMNSKRCMINAVCNTCFDKSKCDGKISKYKNKKVVYKDMKFDSKKEYLRYLVLEDMQRKGEISELKTQVSFVQEPLTPYPEFKDWDIEIVSSDYGENISII